MSTLIDAHARETLRAPVADPPRTPAVSVLVTVTERPAPLDELYREYAAPIRASGRTFEFIFVADPWCEHLLRALDPLVDGREPIRVLRASQPLGETTLLRLACSAARGSVVVTLPAYRRVQAAVLPELIERVEEGDEIVLARRWPRRDSLVNRLQHRLFHALTGELAGSRIQDIACGVRAMRRETLGAIPLYGDFARFLPLLAAREGYGIRELDAEQHGDDRTARVYAPGVYARRLIDVLGVFFLLRFTQKPLRFFGLLGSALAGSGALVLAVLVAQRIAGQGIANRPLLLAGVLLVVLGVQAIALGLVGEIIVHLHAPDRPPYRIGRPPDPLGT